MINKLYTIRLYFLNIKILITRNIGDTKNFSFHYFDSIILLSIRLFHYREENYSIHDIARVGLLPRCPHLCQPQQVTSLTAKKLKNQQFVGPNRVFCCLLFKPFWINSSLIILSFLQKSNSCIVTLSTQKNPQIIPFLPQISG